MGLLLLDVGLFVIGEEVYKSEPLMGWTVIAFILGWSGSMHWMKQLLSGYAKFRRKSEEAKSKSE